MKSSMARSQRRLFQRHDHANDVHTLIVFGIWQRSRQFGPCHREDISLPHVRLEPQFGSSFGNPFHQGQRSDRRRICCRCLFFNFLASTTAPSVSDLTGFTHCSGVFPLGSKYSALPSKSTNLGTILWSSPYLVLAFIVSAYTTFKYTFISSDPAFVHFAKVVMKSSPCSACGEDAICFSKSITMELFRSNQKAFDQSSHSTNHLLEPIYYQHRVKQPSKIIRSKSYIAEMTIPK